MSNLTVSLSPHVRAQSSTRRIMLDVLIALIPAVVFACLLYTSDAADD